MKASKTIKQSFMDLEDDEELIDAVVQDRIVKVADF